MKLNVQNVKAMFLECVDINGEITVDAVVHSFVFSKKRLEENRENIVSLLYQLPNEFKKDNGGGYSFPYACIDIDGCQWGEHVDAERLIALGTAIGLVQCPIPREMWKILPMGLPYYIILSERNIT